jgi:hypothetical protein
MYISLGALIAVGWVAYCFMPALDELFSGDRREMKEIDRKQKVFDRHHHYDERYQCRVRNVDGAVVCYDDDGCIYYCFRDERGLAIIEAPFHPSN